MSSSIGAKVVAAHRGIRNKRSNWERLEEVARTSPGRFMAAFASLSEADKRALKPLLKRIGASATADSDR
ncbi:MAG: hypothetical protein K8I29_01920 [Alphaproteobacteria bacterium]|uniref:Uncharacterized protein n=1 Tax=Candidatus Nitrobium versatile TaxID=2884831 RepID=A0A953J9D8_9BACT|nr:hypothetical protein [Candidatus Nitrobium versatile]